MTELTCFETYDIRGKIGLNIDEGIAYRVGRATAQHLRAKSVVIGFDARETSPAFAASVARGVMDASSDVTDIGMAGTEEMYWAVTEFGACAGIKVTAPHNPINYNGMKIVKSGSRPLEDAEDFLQNWYALSDPMAEETLSDSEAMRRFAGIELGDDRIPDETTILNFRHLLERHGLTEAIFAEVNAHLADKGITLRSGTLVDATIIDAPSSTRNQAKARDPEMSSTKKGNDWYFGIKANVGVDVESGTVDSLEATTAKVHHSRVWDELLHGEEKSVWADKGYASAEREAAFSKEGKVWGIMRTASKGVQLDPIDEKINRIIAKVRAKVEHPFGIIKRQFGHIKTRYRGLAKNRAHLFTLFALGNLFLVRRRLQA